jgi:hypothetical protein
MMIDVTDDNPSSTTSASRRFPRTRTWPSNSSARQVLRPSRRQALQAGCIF